MISPCIKSSKPSNNTPSKTISILFVFLLLLIHTADMWLTRYYIGNSWEREIFLPMRYCIKWFGIYNALWISRISIYSILFLYFLNWKKWKWHYFLITGTILYWAAMLPWLDTLGFFSFPQILKWSFSLAVTKSLGTDKLGRDKRINTGLQSVGT